MDFIFYYGYCLATSPRLGVQLVKLDHNPVAVWPTFV